jgi:hypothetical protein
LERLYKWLWANIIRSKEVIKVCKDLDDDLKEYDRSENDEDERREGEEQTSQFRLALREAQVAC